MNRTDVIVHPYPLKMTPHLFSKVWGGNTFSELWPAQVPTSNDSDEHPPIGEAWSVSDRQGEESYISNGPLQGHSLKQAARIWQRGLLGDSCSKFPLLIKFLDAQQNLSVQVHPGKKDEALIPGAQSKDEVWIVLSSDNGHIYRGFQHGVTPEDYQAALNDHSVIDLLCRIDVQPFDIFHVPPGTIHSLGAGIQILNIQQPSNSTFRIWDYDRNRDLHLDEASQVLSFEPLEDSVSLSASLSDVTFSTEYFEVRTIHVPKVEPKTLHLPRYAPVVINNIEGHATLFCSHQNTHCEVHLAPWDSLVLPAIFDQITLHGESKIVLAGPNLS